MISAIADMFGFDLIYHWKRVEDVKMEIV